MSFLMCVTNSIIPTGVGVSGNGCTVAHGAHRLGQIHSFHPQLDPHRKVLDSNICTKKTAIHGSMLFIKFLGVS